MSDLDRLVWFEGDGWKTEHFALTQPVEAAPQTVSVGFVTETESLTPVHTPTSVSVGHVVETETPQPVTGVFTGIVKMRGTGTVVATGSITFDSAVTILIPDFEIHGRAVISVAAVDPPPTIAEVQLKQKAFVMPRPNLDEGQPS